MTEAAQQREHREARRRNASGIRVVRGIVAGAVLAAASLSAVAASGFTRDEQRLRRAVEDAEMCFHFSGEFNGDGSAHDKDVSRRLRRYCNKQSQHVVLDAYQRRPNDTRLYPAVLMLDGFRRTPLSKAEKARLCAVAKTELVCP